MRSRTFSLLGEERRGERKKKCKKRRRRRRRINEQRTARLFFLIRSSPPITAHTAFIFPLLLNKELPDPLPMPLHSDDLLQLQLQATHNLRRTKKIKTKLIPFLSSVRPSVRLTPSWADSAEQRKKTQKKLSFFSVVLTLFVMSSISINP